MQPTKESIITHALGLSEDDRAEVVEVLSQSIAQQPFFENADVEAAWAEEIKRRIDEIDQGKVKLIPGEQVMKNVRRMLDDRAG